MREVFSCKRCGFCCQGETTVSLDEEDQRRMLDALQITREEALKKYWRSSKNIIQMKTVDGHCIFYRNGCAIHKGRPWRCRQWPLVRALITDESNLQTISSSCPGIDKSASYEDMCKAVGQNDLFAD